MKLIPQKLYNEIITNIPISCVDIALVNEDSIMLVERLDAPAKGQWWLPGGRVLKGEMMKDAAIRKAKQEVGVSCWCGPIIHTAETIFLDGPEGIAVHSINSCFLLVPKSGEIIKLDSHHGKYRWCNRILDNFHPYVKDCLKGAGLK